MGPEALSTSAKKKYEPAVEAGVPRQVETPASNSPLPAPCSTPPAPPSPPDVEDDDDDAAEVGIVLSAVNVGETWQRAIEKIPGMIGEQAKKYSRLDVSGMNRLTVLFSAENAMCKAACQRPEQVLRFEQALKDVTGQTIRVEFKLLEPSPKAAETPARPVVSPHQRLMEAASHPLVRRASELFGAQPTTVDEG